jgi:hypothetical protein
VAATASADPRAGTRRRSLSWVTFDPVVTTAMALFAIQFTVLVGLSVLLYRRFTLGIDFAIYGQAFSQIGQGHLNPYCTVCGYS